VNAAAEEMIMTDISIIHDAAEIVAATGALGTR